MDYLQMYYRLTDFIHYVQKKKTVMTMKHLRLWNGQKEMKEY